MLLLWGFLLRLQRPPIDTTRNYPSYFTLVRLALHELEVRLTMLVQEEVCDALGLRVMHVCGTPLS